MKKFNLTRISSVYVSAALVTSLSFALFACGDNPSPVAPNTLSGESSSSIVGSSSAVSDPSRVIVTDAVIQCDARRTVDDPMLDAAVPPEVYRYVTLEDVGFTIKNISMTCDVVIDSLEVSASDSTLYVNVKYDYENAKRCLCNSEIFFKVDADPVYYSAKELVLNDGGNINFDNKMMIVDLDVVRVEDVPKAYDD